MTPYTWGRASNASRGRTKFGRLCDLVLYRHRQWKEDAHTVPLILDFVPVAREFGRAGIDLVAGAGWLPDHVRAAVDADDVEVQVSAPWSSDRSLVVPMMWKAIRAPFTALDADVRLEPVRADASRLSLSGSYEPAYPFAGRSDERRIEESVRDFLSAVGARLTDGAALR